MTATGGRLEEGAVRLYGQEKTGVRPSLQHNALHMAKYVGELATIAEDADHEDPAKRLRAKARAADWVYGDRPQNFEDHYNALLADLEALARGD